MLLSEDEIRREKQRLARTGVLGAMVTLIPAAVVALLRGQSPWHLPYYHIAIPIAVVFLAPLCYVLMPLFDGTLLLGQPRVTSPRAALTIRCLLTDLIAFAALGVFIHGNTLTWFAVIWALSLPAAFGILRRIGAYGRALDRIVASESAKS